MQQIGGNVKRSLGWFVAAALVVVVDSLGPAAPARADGGGGGGHGGGVARVADRGFALHDAGGGQWAARVELVNAGTGSPLLGLDVSLTGSGPDGANLAPTVLSEQGKGRYEGRFAGPAGPWQLTLAVRSVPGNNVSVLPFTKNATLTATPGGASGDQAAAGAEPASATHRAGGSGSPAPLVGALLGALGVGGLAVLGLRARRARR